MPDSGEKIALFLVVCLAIAMVGAATRASTPNALLRETLKGLVGLAGGIALLSLCIWAVLLVVQA